MHIGFKPYKGVSSNNQSIDPISSRVSVSNPIREYLQINNLLHDEEVTKVSNPIREYLQISLVWLRKL